MNGFRRGRLIEQEVRVGDSQRAYLLYVPSAGRLEAMPLLIAYHGGGSNARDMVPFCGLCKMAEERGILVAFPSGSGLHPEYLTWNAGACCGHASRHAVDDVSFTDHLIKQIQTELALPGGRVFATGISNGGMMCYRLALELSHRIAAIAPVAGAMMCDGPPPAEAVAVLHFHGTDDRFVPASGGRGDRSLRGLDFPALDASIQWWVAANGCHPAPTIESIPSRYQFTSDLELRATRTSYGGCRGGSRVECILVAGGGHTWPGRAPQLPFLGRSTMSLSANELMWEFFQQAV